MAARTFPLTLPGEEEPETDAAEIAGEAIPPDWLTSGAAGAAAGWVFGPVGALVGAAITGILSSRLRKNVMDQVAADQSTAGELDRIIRGELFDARDEAKTDIDRERMDLLIAQQDQYKALLNHYNPQVRQLALQSMLGMADKVGAELGGIETRANERRARERELDQQQWTRYNEVADDLQKTSAQFIEQRSAFGRVIAASANPSPAGDLALIFAFMKVQDPISVVREGEFATAQNAGGVDTTIRALYNRLLTGERLTPEQRNDFVNRSRALYSVARAEQIERNSRFLERARDGNVPEELLDTLAIPIDPGELQFIPPASEAMGGGQREEPEPTALERAAQDATGGTVPESKFARGVQGGIREVVELGEAVGRLGRGEQLVERDGRFFVMDKDGNVLRETEPPQDFVPSPAPIFESFGRSLFSEEAREERRRRSEQRMREQPGLFQPGGFFDRRKRRPTN